MLLPNLLTTDSLDNKHLCVLMVVYPLQMLLEVIKSRPLLVTLWAAIPETLVLLTMAMFWLDLVNTLLMSLEIVDGCEALRSCTSLFSTYVRFVMTSFVSPDTFVRAEPCSVSC
jgi:hypothetical protein